MDDKKQLTGLGVLSALGFETVENAPTVMKWLANYTSPYTRRAYRSDLRDFVEFTGITAPIDFARVRSSHVIAWRDAMTSRGLAASTVRRKLAALSKLFDELYESQEVNSNPVLSARRPNEDADIGLTPAFSAEQARMLLNMPPRDTLIGLRDRAILTTLIFHALRRGELCALRIGDLEQREGMLHFRVRGKGERARFILVAPAVEDVINVYLTALGADQSTDAPLFRPVKNSVGPPDKALNSSSIYYIVKKYSKGCVRALRATAATNVHHKGAGVKEVVRLCAGALSDAG